eukprot:TRINITY_DN9541_c0_g1_i1.p1 TRINITY_DN9541_c0_g1~~TRINITY_DN9541_c0_g1_i1.p1  ORF type:complete len:541 (+),score=29.32 TRINITY_DN9541_c0_g1_i1:67-1623(+)
MSSHETKLQRHARKFRECSTPHAVLEVYATKAQTMKKSELLRHICHVCAWVALAQPLHVAANRLGPKGLSPVRVLTEMISLHGLCRLDDRARAALRAVCSCCDVALESDSCCYKDDWQRLSEVLSRLRKRVRTEVEHSNALTESRLKEQPRVKNDCEKEMNTFEVFAFKRAKRLNVSICKWRQYDLVEGRSRAADMESRLTAILQSASVDTVALRKLLYEAIGALSPPRSSPEQGDQTLRLDDLVAERLRESALIQLNVRKILVNGLNSWRSSLCLEDVQVEPILERVRYLIQSFEERCGHIQHAQASTQWEELKAAVGLCEAQVGLISGETSRPAVKLDQSLPSRGPHVSSKDNLDVALPIQEQPKVVRKTTPRSLFSTIGEYYEVGARFQALDAVVHRPAQPKTLECQHCSHRILASWYFINPNTKKERVIVPFSGHSVCRSKLGNKRLAQFRATDGFPSIRSELSALDYCEHKRERRHCRHCGDHVCQHGRPRDQCKVCGHMVKRRPWKRVGPQS